jgi:O-antigen/teichoic acid export membrane protein
MSRIRQLGKDSIIYGLGGVLAKSLSFFLLPIYTRIFSPAEYGTIEMLVVISSFLAAFLVMGMDSAQSMYFYKWKERGKPAQARLISAILQWRLIWGGAVVLVATVASPAINAFFFQGLLGWEYFAIAFFGSLFSQIMIQSAEIMRLLYRPWSYIGITLTQSIISATIALVLIIIFDFGILGFLLGAAGSSVLAGVFGWFRVRDYINFSRIHWDLWPKLLRFGAPLVPAGLAMYFMSAADRWFVQYYHGSSELGLFAVGAKFAMLLSLVVETFRKAWWPIAMEAMQAEDGPQTFRMIARLYAGIGSVGVVILTFLSPWLVEWFTAPAYAESWRIVGVLAWQPLFYGFFLIVSAGIWKAEKTHLTLYLMSSGALLGLVLNWLLVPVYAGVGAALATALTYFVWIVLAMILSEKLWYVGFPKFVLFMQLMISFVFVCWFYYFGIETTFFTLSIVVTLTVVFQLFMAIEYVEIKGLLRYVKK